MSDAEYRSALGDAVTRMRNLIKYAVESETTKSRHAQAHDKTDLAIMHELNARALRVAQMTLNRPTSTLAEIAF